MDDFSAIGAHEDQSVVKSDYVGRGDQKPVLVDVIQLSKAPDVGGIAWPSVVGLYDVEDKRPGLGEGLTYRRVASFGVFVEPGLKVPFRLIARERYLARQRRVDGASKARPNEIHDAVKRVDRIAQMKWQIDRNVLFGTDQDCSNTGLQIVLDNDNARVVGDDRCDDRFDSIHVVFGPFNLKLSVGGGL